MSGAHDICPDGIAVALHDGMRPADVERFVRIERRVDPAVDDGRAGRSRRVADFVAPQRVAGVNADRRRCRRRLMVEMSIWLSVSSTMTGSPNSSGVAAAMTYSQRGVMTPTPNDTWLGLTR